MSEMADESQVDEQHGIGGDDEYVLVNQAEALQQLEIRLAKQMKAVERTVDSLESRYEKIKSAILCQKKFWETFISFNWLVLPALISAVVASCCSQSAVISEVQAVIVALLSVSVVVGIPSYLFALRELEIHNTEIKEKFVIGRRSPTNKRASLDKIATVDSGNDISSSENDDHEMVEDCTSFKTSPRA